MLLFHQNCPAERIRRDTWGVPLGLLLRRLWWMATGRSVPGCVRLRLVPRDELDFAMKTATYRCEGCRLQIHVDL
jgi:hypothetical protein